MMRALGLAALLMASALCALPARAETVTVFAAASLKNAFDAIGAAFEAETGIAVVTSYAGTSALARQIEQGAPADLFVSANQGWTDYLLAREVLDAASVRTIAGNRLVVVAPAGAAQRPIPFELDLADAWLSELGESGRIAVALVDAVPAGLYARQALEGLDLWEVLSPRLAQSDTVRSALFLVARGEAPLGIVYATDALAEAKVEQLAIFPAPTHEAISYTASRTMRSEMQGAEQLLDFLIKEQARAILRGQGFVAAR